MSWWQPTSTSQGKLNGFSTHGSMLPWWCDLGSEERSFKNDGMCKICVWKSAASGRQGIPLQLPRGENSHYGAGPSLVFLFLQETSAYVCICIKYHPCWILPTVSLFGCPEQLPELTSPGDIKILQCLFAQVYKCVVISFCFKCKYICIFGLACYFLIYSYFNPKYLN